MSEIAQLKTFEFDPSLVKKIMVFLVLVVVSGTGLFTFLYLTATGAQAEELIGIAETQTTNEAKSKCEFIFSKLLRLREFREIKWLVNNGYYKPEFEAFNPVLSAPYPNPNSGDIACSADLIYSRGGLPLGKLVTDIKFELSGYDNRFAQLIVKGLDGINLNVMLPKHPIDIQDLKVDYWKTPRLDVSRPKSVFFITK
jgi:hypothetical protein